MSGFRFDSYCGQYCGACDILVAYKEGIETGIPPEWDNLPTQLENLPFNARAAEIKCLGCKTDTVFSGCAKCIIRKCAIDKKIAGTCLDCNSYRCWRFKVTGLIRKISGLERKLPHLKFIDQNMRTIQREGLATWTKEQEIEWKCPQCGKQLTWYRGSCGRCKEAARTPAG